MIYPDTTEHKIGFDSVRENVTALCSSALGRSHAEAMAFSSDFAYVQIGRAHV